MNTTMLYKKKILIIDDDEAILEVMQTLLEEEGYEVKTDAKGVSVHTLSTDTPELILLDVLLSGESGMDLCKKIKGQESTKNIPVIMLSAHSNIDQTAKLCGADAYLPKPFDIDVLLAVVKKYIGKTASR